MKTPANEKPFTTSDGEVREDLTDAELDALFAQAKRFADLPAALQTKLRGRPKSTAPKASTTIRFDRDVLDAFRAAGPGWQSRMNAALREWLAQHRPAKRGA